MSINISNAKFIPGWMEESELWWLASRAQMHRRIVEVGSWMGRSTRALADNTDGCVFSVDTWKGSSEHHACLADKPESYLRTEFGRYMESHLKTGKVVVYSRLSLDVAKMFADLDATFDMVFLDASHDYESVVADITAWSKVLKPRGLLCGHDYGNCDAITGERYNGLVKAVSECLPTHEVMRGGSIWYVV